MTVTAVNNMSNAEKRDVIRDLEKKVEALERVEKHQARQLEIAAQEMTDLQEQIQLSDRMEKMRAWGVDRAIAISQLDKDGKHSVTSVLSMADVIADYVYGKKETASVQ